MLALQIPPTESENDDDTINRVRQPSTMARQHEIGIMRCIHSIQLAFAGRYEEYSKSSNSETTGPPIDIGLSSIDSSPVGYHFLARQWARQSVLAHAARKRLQFNLPETLEGTQCAISFDMSYEVLPFPVNGPRATSILNDLDVLSNSSVEVVQTVPLSSIDASLLFGLPITVKNGRKESLHYSSRLHLNTDIRKALRKAFLVVRVPKCSFSWRRNCPSR
jgi:hypothetical protein